MADAVCAGVAAVVILIAALCGCGRMAPLTPAQGEPLPVKPLMAQALEREKPAQFTAAAILLSFKPHLGAAIVLLALVYLVLYMLFGYYVAWQSPAVRLFYSGSTELPSVWNQWAATLMAKPELPVFQYFRGVLWILCLVPLFMGFSGKRIELVILSALALALLPTAALAFANPLMPAGVSLAHFWEVSISTGIFGALCAWFVPKMIKTA